MKYIWTEDTKAGLHYWNLVNQYLFQNEYVVESKGSNQGILDILCFEYMMLSFSKLIEWTGTGKTDKIAMREVVLSAIKEHKMEIDSITDRRTLEYLAGFKKYSTERVIKSLT